MIKKYSTNMVLVKFPDQNFPQIFRTQKSFLEVIYKSSCSVLINTVMKYLNFRSNGSKLESVSCKFTKNRTPSQYFFGELHHRCWTAILKIASWWLLLGTTLFWKYCWMAASQRQLQRYIYRRNSKLHIFCISYCYVRLKRNKVYGFLLGVIKVSVKSVSTQN